MTIGELLQLAKSNLIEDAYYAVEGYLVGSNENLEGEVTPTMKQGIEEELALYDYEWSDLVFVDNIKLNESSNTDFKPMSKVYHKKYGVGVILRDSGKDCREGEVIFKPDNNSSLPLIPHPSRALSGPEHYTSDIVSISDLSKEPFNESKIDLKPILESVVKKLKQEGRYFQEKDNIKKMVLKEAMDLAKVKNNKQVIANKMRGGKVQLKEAKVTKTQLFQSLDNKNISSEKLTDLDSMVKLVDTVLDKEFDIVADNTQELVKEYMKKKGVLKEGIFYLNLEKGETYAWTGGAEYANIKYIGKTSENPEAKIGSSMGKGLLFQWSDGKYFELSPNAVKKYVNKKDLEESKKSNKRTLKEEINAKPLRKFKARIQEYERYSTGSTKKFSGSAESLGAFILKLMSKTSWDKEEVEENKDALLNSPESEVISNFEDNNGDGGDYYTIYEIIGGSEKLLIGGDNEEEEEEELDEAVKKTLPHRAAYAARNAARGDKYVLMLFGVHTSEEYDNEEGITFAKSLEEAANKIDLQYPREEYTIENNMMYCELDEHYEYLFLCKETDIDQAHSEWLKLSEWGMDDEDEDELDEAVTVPLETLEKDTDKISKVAEKTDITITENKQNKMKTNEEKIKSLTEAIQKMTGKKVLLKEYPTAIADKVVRSKHIDDKTKSRYAMSKAEQGPSDSELEDFDLDSLDLDDDFGSEETRIFDESTGSLSARRASGKPRLQEDGGESKKEIAISKLTKLVDKLSHLQRSWKSELEQLKDGTSPYLRSDEDLDDLISSSDKLNSGMLEESKQLKEYTKETMDKVIKSKHIDQATKDKYAKDKKRRENPYDMTGKIVDNFPFQGRMTESVKRKRIKSLTEAIQKRTGKKVVLAEKKKDIIKTLKEEITKRAKLVYYIKTGKKVTLKETAGEEETTLEDKVNLENSIDTPTLGNIMPTSIIKTIEQYVSTTLAEIDKSTTELRTIKKNIVLNSGPSDGSFETLINRIGFLLKQLERIQRYTSNTIKAGVFNKSILDKLFDQKELINEIK